MTYRFLQLNIFKGKYFNTVVEFVKKEQFDVLQFQEVAGGKESFTGFDLFPVFKEELGMEGILATSWAHKGDTQSYFGNATFYKKEFPLLTRQVTWLRPYEEFDVNNPLPLTDWPRNALSLTLSLHGLPVTFVNTHLAWAKTGADTEHKIAQGKKLLEYIQSLENPFILSGDFNVIPDSYLVKGLRAIANSPFLADSSVVNTLNSRNHHARELFPPGIVVDYIFTHPSIAIHRYNVIGDIDLSDHLGLTIEFTV